MDGSCITLFFGGGRLYSGEREYYELNGRNALLTAWLGEILQIDK